MTDDKFANEGTKHSQANRLAYTIGADENPSEVVIKAVVTVTNTNILDLEPSYHVIDPDHIDEISEKAGDSGGNTEISFEFNGCKVKVNSEEITIRNIKNT